MHVFAASKSLVGVIPANTQRNKHVIITSKRRFDVLITCLLRGVFAGIWLAAYSREEVIILINDN